MPQMSAKSQLQTIATGTGQSASYRDASDGSRSNGLTNGSGPWTSQPTPIKEPSNSRQPQMRRMGDSPFSAPRFRSTLDTLQSKPGLGNRTSRKTVLPQSTSKYFPGVFRNDRALPPQASTAATNIVDSDEDVGTPIAPPRTSLSSVTRSGSPDPIDGLTPDKSAKSISKKAVATMKTNPTWKTASDGASTRQLQRKLGGQTIDIDSDENDTISNCSDGPSKPPTRPSRPPEDGKVRRLTELYENRSESVPHLDLKGMSRISQRMRGNPKKARNTKLDPEATAPSGYTTSPKPTVKASSPKTRSYVLPLEAHFFGTALYEGGSGNTSGWFCLEGACMMISKTRDLKPTQWFGAHLTGFCSEMELTMYPCDKQKPVIITIATHNATHKYPNVVLEGFKHGDPGQKGTMGFKFLTGHPEWNDEGYESIYKALSTLLHGKITFSNSASSVSSWEMACNLLKNAETEHSDDSFSGSKRLRPDNQLNKTTLARSEAITSSKEAELHAVTATRPQPRPAGVANPSVYSTRRAIRASLAGSVGTSTAPDPDELVLVYPPSGTGAVHITNGDIKRLDPGQYLNDTLIEFALKLWLNQLRDRDAELAEQIHIFSSFFYKKIQVKNKAEGYSSVRKWTSKLDLFKKKYIVVPINEHLHWYLAIICNPEFVLQPPPPSSAKPVSAVQTRKRKRDSDTLPHETLVISPELLPSFEPALENLSANAEDEHSVEALLTGWTISQDKQPSDPTPPVPDNEYESSDDLHGALLYPPSDDVPAELPVESSTEAGGSSRDESAPIVIDDDLPETNGEEVPMEVDEPDGDAVESTSAVPCASFYGHGHDKGKQRVIELSPEVPYVDPAPAVTDADVPNLDLDNESEEPPAAEATNFLPNKTYIFTFDSLGTKHPAAIKNLSTYLQMEATDKKGLEASQTTSPTGATALVPAQPNFCDCGIYLIHFVQTFMQRPTKFSEKIVTKKAKDYDSKERELDWEADVVGNLRETLRAEVLSLSDEWKKEKIAKEEQKKREAAEASTTTVPEAEVMPESDDDEIIVGEVITKAAAKKGLSKGKQVAKGEKAGEVGDSQAMRLR